MTMYSNRTRDEQINKRVNVIMNAVYDRLGWSAWRPEVSEWDKRGIDVILRRPGDEKVLWLDEKAATKYWDKDLHTFACELSCCRIKSRYGWFAKESNNYHRNSHLGFIWVRALEPELVHISNLTYRIVNKADLQNYFLLATGMTAEDDTLEYLDKLEFDDYGRCKINDDLTIRKCNICPEYPIVAVFSENILSRLSIFEREFDRFEIRDSLRAAREKRLREDREKVTATGIIR